LLFHLKHFPDIYSTVRSIDLFVCFFVSQWMYQATMRRINGSLIKRGYLTWWDVTNMKGT